MIRREQEEEGRMRPKVGLAFLIGFAVGAATALLLAPQSGEETRDWIADQSRRGVKQARKGFEQASRAVEDAVERSADVIDRGTDRITEAVDATRKAYSKVSGALG
jgi:gas vesicle protein